MTSDSMDREQFVRKVRKSGSSLSISVPNEIVRLLKIKEGEIVRVIVEKIKPD